MLPMPWDGRVAQGFDISAAQLRLDMRRIARAPRMRVMTVKATDWDFRNGRAFEDPRCRQHLADGRAVGFDDGTYGFFHSNVPWRPQAEAYLRTFDAVGPQKVRPTLDWEDMGGIRAAGGTAARDNGLAWLEFVHVRTGRRPQVYTGPGVIAVFGPIDLSDLLRYTLWEAHYRWDPVTGHDYGLAGPGRIVLGGELWVPAWWQCGGNGAPHVDADDPDGSKLPDLDRDVCLLPTEESYQRWLDDGPTTDPAPPPSPPISVREPDPPVALVEPVNPPGTADPWAIDRQRAHERGDDDPVATRARGALGEGIPTNPGTPAAIRRSSDQLRALSDVPILDDETESGPLTKRPS